MSANEGSLGELLCDSPSALQWVYPEMTQESEDNDFQEKRNSSTKALGANCSETSFTTRLPVSISEFPPPVHLKTSKEKNSTAQRHLTNVILLTLALYLSSSTSAFSTSILSGTARDFCVTRLF